MRCVSCAIGATVVELRRRRFVRISRGRTAESPPRRYASWSQVLDGSAWAPGER